jgi:DNA-binding MarR family transcriptional regulator
MTSIKTTDCPYYLISRIYLQVTSALKKGFERQGVDKVKPAYLGVLLTLWREDGLKLGELARRSGLEPSSMTGLIDRMERDGFALRSPDKNDRRAQIIHLTDDSFNIKDRVMSVVDSVLSETFNGIPEDDVLKTREILKQVLENSKKDL